MQAVGGLILLDSMGLVLGWRLFDHAAHLGGSLFGLAYAYGGEAWLSNSAQPAVLQAWRTLRGEAKPPD